VNTLALSSVNRFHRSVELLYEIEDSVVLKELERLVAAEQGCCAAAGVEFELVKLRHYDCVAVKTVREGLPSQTVIAAFAAMSPPGRS